MQFPLVTRKTHNRLLVELGDTRLALIELHEAKNAPLTRGWAAELNYNLFFAPDAKLRGLITAALQDAAGKAMRPGADKAITPDNVKEMGRL